MWLPPARREHGNNLICQVSNRSVAWLSTPPLAGTKLGHREEAFVCPCSGPAGCPRVAVLQKSLCLYSARARVYLMASDDFPSSLIGSVNLLWTGAHSAKC